MIQFFFTGGEGGGQTKTKRLIRGDSVSLITKASKVSRRVTNVTKKCCEKVPNKCSPNWSLADFKLTMNANV